jgi:LysM repeat protein
MDASSVNKLKMNTPSPLVPQGAFQDKGKSHVRITVFAILAVHVVLLGVLLIAGCNKKTDLAENPAPPPVTTPPPDQWPSGTAPNANPSTTSPDTSVPPVPLPPPVTTPSAAPDTFAPVTTPGGATTSVPTVVTPPPTIVTPEGTVTPTPADIGSAPMIEHTVAKGEVLATIGKKYGVGYKAIEAANPGLNPTRLKIGEKIKIPARTATPTTTAAVSSGTANTSVYVVKSGDNLLKISKTTGVPVKQLRAANNLRTDQIRVGQKLKIPSRASSPPAEATAPPPVAPPITLPSGQ